MDHLLRTEPHWDRTVIVTPEHLTESVTKFTHARGAARFRLAATLARQGADSRMETLLRLAGESVGIDDLELQGVVFDAEGLRIGRFDLVDPVTRRFLEYDGEQHRTSRVQYLRDIERLDRAYNAGWRGERFHAEDLLGDRQVTATRMLLRLEREPRRITPELARFLDETWGCPTERAGH